MDVIETLGIVKVDVPDMSKFNEENQEEFAMIRRSGLGASDSSIILGVNKWKTVEDLIKEKRSTVLTEEEISVGKKAAVRKGHDVEPIILDKFSKQFTETIKPDPMYRFINEPQLTLNFDGVSKIGDTLVPVEAKCVSPYGDKYWDKTKAITSLSQTREYRVGYGDVAHHIEESAKLYGIPGYYYTQIQQQMMALNAPFGYFAVIFDKDWEFKVFFITKDEYVQQELINKSREVWDKIKRP